MNTGVNGKAVVHVGGQLPGVGVKQAVDFLMVHGINALFLCLRDFKGIIHIMPVLRRGAAGLVIGLAVHLLGAAGCTLIDGIIAVSYTHLDVYKRQERLYQKYGEVKKELADYGIIKQNVDSILRVTPHQERTQEL